MPSIHLDLDNLEWRPGSAKYGDVAVHDGKEIIESAILSDRRPEGGGLALLSKRRLRSRARIQRSTTNTPTSTFALSRGFRGRVVGRMAVR